MSRVVPNRQIAEEAAEWAVRIDGGPLQPDEREALAAWLKASPVHVDELLYSAAIMAGLCGVDGDRTLSIEAFLADSAPEVIPLFVETAPKTAGSSQSRAAPGSGNRVPRGGIALAASLAAVGMLGLVLASPPQQRAQVRQTMLKAYSTDLGEQRSITLPDGSIVFLNTSSSVRIRVGARERQIDLLRGEALFEVARDPERPFRVFANGTMAQAIGTKFNVKHTPRGINVVVVEGKVLVDSRAERTERRARSFTEPAPSERIDQDQALLTAGEQAELSSSVGVPVVRKADIVAAASWRMWQLSFDDAGLGEIVAEFNRYNRTPIVLSDPALDRTRFSGVFDANDPQSFVAFLELSTTVKVDRSDPSRIVLRPRLSGSGTQR